MHNMIDRFGSLHEWFEFMRSYPAQWRTIVIASAEWLPQGARACDCSGYRLASSPLFAFVRANAPLVVQVVHPCALCDATFASTAALEAHAWSKHQVDVRLTLASQLAFGTVCKACCKTKSGSAPAWSTICLTIRLLVSMPRYNSRAPCRTPCCKSTLPSSTPRDAMLGSMASRFSWQMCRRLASTALVSLLPLHPLVLLPLPLPPVLRLLLPFAPSRFPSRLPLSLRLSMRCQGGTELKVLREHLRRPGH